LNLISGDTFKQAFTEWKKASTTKDAGKKFEQARLQARRYAQGALAGSELTTYPYAVVISRQQIQTPDDLMEDGVQYRHINIAVDPPIPSRG